MGDSGTLTEVGTVLGTASYISPEQAGGLAAGPASDVYSFGVILFRMLTGSFPFVSANAMELVRMHRDDTPLTVASARPDAPARLAGIVAVCLAKDPAARPPDGAALVRELRGAGETRGDPSPANAGQAAQPVADRAHRGSRCCCCSSQAGRSRSSSRTAARAAAPPRQRVRPAP